MTAGILFCQKNSGSPPLNVGSITFLKNLSDTAMSVYREASQKGNTDAMERAPGYAGQMTNQTEAYEAKAEKGMKADAKELKVTIFIDSVYKAPSTLYLFTSALEGIDV